MPGVDLTLDWWWLYLQIALLSAIIVREVIRPRNRNLYAILITTTMLVLVQGQAWWVLARFEQGNTAIRHLNQDISLDGARLANLYLGLAVLCYCIALALPAANRGVTRVSTRVRSMLPETRLSYTMATIWTIVAGALLIQGMGGLRTAVTSPGAAIAGLTALLVATGLGKLPLLRRIATGGKPEIADVAIFGVAMLLTLINSRFLAAFALLQLALLLNYCWREAPRRSLLGLALGLVFIFIVYGLYRESAWRYGGVDLQKLSQLLVAPPENDTVLDWFYRANVEGFAGLAGLLTYESVNGPIAHDFGLSNLSIITQLLPNALRNDPSLPFRDVARFLESLYPSSGSVVSPGPETAYAHFGLPGILGLGALLGYLAGWLHAQMLNPRADRLKIALISVQSLNLVRSSFRNVIFFALADLAMLWIYRVMLTVGKRVRVAAILATKRKPQRASG